MSMTSTVVFILYLLVMIAIGLFFSNKSKNLSDYFLGGRQMGALPTALSAQASDMSGWLLMGLPGALYLLGFCEAWIAIGLGIGTYLNWLLVAKRLRVYSYGLDNALTMPEYLSNRFGAKGNALNIVMAIFITIFFLIYTASAIVSCGTLFSTVFGWSYNMSLVIGWVIILIYTVLGGFMAVCWTDVIQGILMFLAILFTACTLMIIVGGTVSVNVGEVSQTYFSFGASWKSIVSNLAWGLGYFGMPHIVVRFMAIKSPEMIKTSRRVAMVWVVISLAAACLIGIFGRAYLGMNGAFLPDGAHESIFLVLVQDLFPPVLVGLFMAAVLAAVMSTADSQLLVSASAITNDLIKNVRPQTSDKKLVWISRIAVFVIACIALIIAWNPENSIMGLVANGWAGLGSAFGPIMLCSLFWRKTTLKGGIAGIIVGGVVSLAWAEFLAHTGIYAMIPGFFLGLLAIIVVSLIDKDRSAEEIYDRLKAML